MPGFLRHITFKRKILILGLILILVPGAIISYLSLKSIAQKAENLREKYKGTVSLVKDKLEGEIFREEAKLRSNVTESSLKSENKKDIRAWLGNFELENLVFKNLFLVRKDGGLITSSVSLGWEKSPESPPLLNPQAAENFKNAENAEFIRKDYREAARLYQDALTFSKSATDRALLMSRIGRCFFKTGDFKTGISEYEKIIAMGNQEVSIGNIPAEILALTQIAEGYKAQGAEKERQDVLMDLYSHLLNQPWDLENGDYLYYLKSVRDELDKVKITVIEDIPGEKITGEMESRENFILDQISFIESVHREVLPELSSEMKRNPSSGSAAFSIFPTGSKTESPVGFIRLSGSFQQSGLSVLGYRFNRDYIMATLFPGILASVELGKDVLVGILGNNDNLLYIQNDQAISDYLITDDFSQFFAGWKVALFDREGKTIEELMGKEKQLYLVLFAGIIILMLIGVVVTVRAVIRESEISRMKSEFVSSVSHELKTPLSLIRMFGETLDTGIVTDESKRKEFYGIIRKESERLTHLINNVLDFSKMDTGAKKYYFEEADLAKVVRNSLEAYKFHVRDNGFEIESMLPDDPIMLKIDRDAISQALLNLLSNAVKYSEEKKYIRVKVEKQTDFALISVTDRGIGIPKDHQKRIFDKFYQAPAAGKERQGSGLGLTLVKHIAEAHGGKVEVDSEVGKGSTFAVRIPLPPVKPED